MDFKLIGINLTVCRLLSTIGILIMIQLLVVTWFLIVIQDQTVTRLLIVIWLLVVFWQLTVTQDQISHSNTNSNWTPTSISATNSNSRSN